MADRKLLRKRPDGSYEGIALGEGGATYDRNLKPETAREMWAKGGYEELDEDAVDFEAARLIAGADTSGGVPKRISVRRQLDGDDDPANDEFQIDREFPSGLQMGQKGGRGLVNSLSNMGGERVRLEPDLPTNDPHDAKMDGFSNPSARPDMTAMDGPRNPNPMPRAGMPAKKPGIQVGMPAQGRDVDPSRIASQATSGTAAPGLDRVAKKSPQVAAYMLQRMQGQQDPLTAAREQSNGDRFGVRLARAGSMANQALTGAKMDTAAWDDLEQSSQQPLEDLGARRKMDREDAAEGRATGADARAQAAEGRASAEGQREADLYDPASSRSRQARSMLMLRFRNQVAKMPPDEFRNLSAADVVELAKGFGADRDDDATERRHREDLSARSADRAESRAFRMFQQGEASAARKETAKAKEVQMRERQDEKDMQELQKRTDGVAAMGDDLRTVNSFIEKGGDLPGVGPIAGRLPELLVSSEGVHLRQSASRLVQAVIYAKSGKAITEQEAKRVMDANGMGTGASEDAFIQGMQALAREARATMGNKQAPFAHVVPEYRARGGVTAEDMPGPATRPTGETVEMEDGSVWEVMENGKARRIR